MDTNGRPSQSGREKHKYTVSITRLCDDGYGNRTTTVITKDTWAVSERKAISNVRYRMRSDYAESPGKPVFFDTYSAELVS